MLLTGQQPDAPRMAMGGGGAGGGDGNRRDSGDVPILRQGGGSGGLTKHLFRKGDKKWQSEL
ncbi:MAG: hypothetical protein KAJ19_27590 [Gammaproteobacteria bacterium]|nr:hypothetical protein [Gammaproteobacteria bacterium]